MKFKVDENLPDEVAAILRSAGHDAESVREEGLQGSSDATLAERCCSERRAILTLDLDFADIRQYPPARYAGILVMRLVHQDKPHVLGVVRRIISTIEGQTVAGTLWIVGEEGIRIRAGG